MSVDVMRIADEVCDLMEKEEWEYSNSVCGDITIKSILAKTDLRNIFHDSKYYDEYNDAIVCVREFHRYVDYNPVSELLRELIIRFGNNDARMNYNKYAYGVYQCGRILSHNFDFSIEKSLYLYPRYRDAYDEWLYSDDGKVWQMCRELCLLAERETLPQYLSPELADYAKNLGLKGMNKGKKMSRVFRQLVKLSSKGNEISESLIVRACDGINPLTYKRKVVLSLNIMDYLTQSVGHNWTSCHLTDKLGRLTDDTSGYTGCYCSGTLSYALDETSFVYYELDEDDDVHENWYNGGKIRRCMFEYDVNEGILVQGRVYPDDQSDQFQHDDRCYAPIREIVQELIDECLPGKGNWTDAVPSNEICNKYIESHGTHYKDYACYSNPNISLRKSDNALMYKGNKIVIGHDPICVTCGRVHYEASQLSCCYPLEVEKCYWCDEVIPASQLCYSSEEDRYYCPNCCVYDDYYESYVRGNEYELTWVEGIGHVSPQGLEEGLNRFEIVYCSTCEQYERVEDQIVDRWNEYHCDVDNYEYVEDGDYWREKEDEYDEVI